MYLRDVLDSCLRRWWLLVACLMISTGAVLLASTVVVPTYEATASVVLIPPQNPEEPNQNRYLGLGGLTQSADVLSGSMMSEETSDSLVEAEPDAEYEVLPDFATSAPILKATVTSKSSDACGAMLELVLTQMPANLQALQDSVGIKSSNQITQVLVSRDTAPAKVEKARIRILAALSVGLMLFTALLVAAVDGLLLRRSARKQAPSETATADRSAATAVHEPSPAAVSHGSTRTGSSAPRSKAPDQTRRPGKASAGAKNTSSTRLDRTPTTKSRISTRER